MVHLIGFYYKNQNAVPILVRTMKARKGWRCSSLLS